MSRPVLDAVVAVLDGTGDPSTLMHAVVRAREEVASLGAEADAAAAALPLAARQGAAEALAAIHEALAVYESGLGIVGAGIDSRSVVDLTRGAEFVRRAWLRLDGLLTDFRNAALRAAGPSELADYNQIYHLYLRHRETGDERLGAALATMRARAIRVGARAEAQPPSPERTEVMEACRRHQEVCESLLAHLEADRLDAVEVALEELYAALEAFRDLATRVELSQRAAIPTPSPQVNFMLSVLDDFIAGRVDDATLAEAVEQCAAWHANLRGNFLGASGQESSASVEAEIKRARAAIVKQAEAVRRLERFFESRDLDDLEQGRALLKASAEALHEAHEALRALSENEGRSPCLQCGTYNDLTRKTCGRCGARVVHAETFGGLRSTFQIAERIEVGEHVGRLLQAVNEVTEGTITPAQFSGEIDVFEQRLLAVTCPPPDDAASEEVKGAALEFKAGLDEFHEGLASMRDWLDSGSAESLAAATRQVWAAHGRMRSVQKVGAGLR